jgi:hypothetical protein
LSVFVIETQRGWSALLSIGLGTVWRPWRPSFVRSIRHTSVPSRQGPRSWRYGCRNRQTAPCNRQCTARCAALGAGTVCEKLPTVWPMLHPTHAPSLPHTPSSPMHHPFPMLLYTIPMHHSFSGPPCIIFLMHHTFPLYTTPYTILLSLPPSIHYPSYCAYTHAPAYTISAAIFKASYFHTYNTPINLTWDIFRIKQSRIVEHDACHKTEYDNIGSKYQN